MVCETQEEDEEREDILAQRAKMSARRLQAAASGTTAAAAAPSLVHDLLPNLPEAPPKSQTQEAGDKPVEVRAEELIPFDDDEMGDF